MTEALTSRKLVAAVVRSPWDYARRSDEFQAWCRAIGPDRLRNPPDLVAFNRDERS